MFLTSMDVVWNAQNTCKYEINFVVYFFSFCLWSDDNTKEHVLLNLSSQGNVTKFFQWFLYDDKSEIFRLQRLLMNAAWWFCFVISSDLHPNALNIYDIVTCKMSWELKLFGGMFQNRSNIAQNSKNSEKRD